MQVKDKLIETQTEEWQKATILVIDHNDGGIIPLFKSVCSHPIVKTDGETLKKCLMKASKYQKPYPLILINAKMDHLDLVAITRELKTRNVYRNPSIVFFDEQTPDLAGLEHVDEGFALSVDAQTLKTKLLSLWIERNEYHNHLFEKLASVTPSILLVEDDPINMKVVSMMLGNFKCDLQTATTGNEAIAKATTQPFDIIFLDIGLPDINGYDIATTLRETENPNKNTRLIAITAFISERELLRCFDVGMDDIVTKPVNIRDLKMTVACNFPGL